jgi:integrase
VLTYAFARLIRASGLTRVRLHDLRHGHATHLLVANTHPKVVQERLGHANIQLTLDTYSHVLPSMQQDAATTRQSSAGRRGSDGGGMVKNER